MFVVLQVVNSTNITTDIEGSAIYLVATMMNHKHSHYSLTNLGALSLCSFISMHGAMWAEITLSIWLYMRRRHYSAKSERDCVSKYYPRQALGIGQFHKKNFTTRVIDSPQYSQIKNRAHKLKCWSFLSWWRHSVQNHHSTSCIIF